MTAPRYVKVPVDLPPEVLKQFLLTDNEGNTGQDAWHNLIHQVGRAVTHLGPEVEQERAIVQIKDVYGEPALVFPDTPHKQLVILLSHLTGHIVGHPVVNEALIKAIARWRVMKGTGSLPKP